MMAAKPIVIGVITDHRNSRQSSQRDKLVHRNRKSSFRSCPSSGLLSILASIAASSSTVDGSPLAVRPSPPLFLCPSIETGSPSPIPVLQLDNTPDPYLYQVSSKPRWAGKNRGRVPDQYTPDSNGQWRRVENVYTLYGSAICPSCETSSTSVATPSVVDDSVQSSSTSSSTPTHESGDIDLSTLPKGWQPVPHEGRTTLILALSLVLAFFICCFIIGAIFWRKHRQRKETDVEKKMRKRRRDESHRDNDLLDKEYRTKQKLLAKATARWKANIRHSARQRRGKRAVPRHTQAQASAVDLRDERDGQDEVSFVTSRSPSPGRSIATIQEPLSPAMSIHSTTRDSQSSAPYSTPPITALSSPPAYHQRVQTSIHPDDNDFSHKSPEAPAGPSMDYPPESDTEEPIPYTASFYAAHVATDDKAFLARLDNLASAPPADSGDAIPPSGSSALVPPWVDEDLNDFPQPSYTDIAQPDLPFPSPPSKTVVTTSSFYDYTYSFDDLTSLEPSCPPFEEQYPSAPPLEVLDLLPSAPPLADEPYEQITPYVGDHRTSYGEETDPVLGREETPVLQPSLPRSTV